MNGYYDMSPTVALERPLLLVGLPGSGVGAVSRDLALFTGLPWVHLDRAVEHAAGASIDALILRSGEVARAAIERELLPSLLRQPLPHVVALGETTLVDPLLAEMVRSERVIYLHRPRELLWARLRERLGRKPGHRWATLFGELDPRSLGPVFDRWEAAMRAVATEVIDAGARDDRRIALELKDGLTPIVSTG